MSFGDELEIESSGEFLKLEAGKVANIHILSEKPEKSFVHWTEDKKKVSCLGMQKCELCMTGNKPKQTWTCMVYDRKDESVRKFEFGAMIARQLKSISELMAESGQTIHDIDLRIKKEGSNLDTEYTVLHQPMKGPVPSEILDKYRIPF